MPRFKKPSEHVPDEWIWCPICKRPYGFIGCRVSKKEGEMCLRCSVEKEKENTLPLERGKVSEEETNEADIPLNAHDY